MNNNKMQNKRGEWVPVIPKPFYGFRKVCNCGKKFWREQNYKEHYAYSHALMGELPL